MKKTFLLLIIGFICSNISAQGIEFFHGSWKEALEKAKSEDKLIFVDAYTTWCGPCKRMASQVFPQQKVGDFYNQNFINVKLDMEKAGDGKTFRQKYRVNAFPTLLFINGEGKIAHSSRGGKQPDAFIGLGKTALKKGGISQGAIKKYKEGDRTPQTVLKYAKSMKSSNEPYLPILEEYFKSQKDLSTKQNLKAMFDFADAVDTKPFDLMLSNKDKIIEAFGRSNFNNKVLNACKKEVLKAAEANEKSWMDNAKSIVKSNVSKTSSEFNAFADVLYAQKTSNWKTFPKYAVKYVEKYKMNDYTALMNYSKLIKENVSNDKYLVKAIKWEQAAKKLKESRK